MRILQANDDITGAAQLEVMLGCEGFVTFTTDYADEAVELAKMYDYDLILLADVEGAHRVLQQLRNAKVQTPVLRLSAGGDAVAALDAGADDFVIQPVSAAELVSRIHAITRRARGHAESRLQVGPLTVNLTTRTSSVDGVPLALTGKEYAMVELLALRKGSLITKEMFLNHLYGGMDEPEIKIIDVFICKIRKKIKVELIETVWGRGYILRDPGAAAAADLGPEVRDFSDDPPTGFVSDRTFADHREESKASGKIKSPSLVPALGQK